MSTMHDLYLDPDDVLSRLVESDDRPWKLAAARWIVLFILLPWLVLLATVAAVIGAFLLFAVTIGTL